MVSPDWLQKYNVDNPLLVRAAALHAALKLFLAASVLRSAFDEHLGDAELVMRLADPQGYIEAGEGWGLKRLVYRLSGR